VGDFAPVAPGTAPINRSACGRRVDIAGGGHQGVVDWGKCHAGEIRVAPRSARRSCREHEHLGVMPEEIADARSSLEVSPRASTDDPGRYTL